MRRTETPKPIWIKICTVVDIPDVVTYTNFGDHRLRGFRVAGGQISPSPIDFHRRPYNTLALPCDRVIRMFTTFFWFFQSPTAKTPAWILTLKTSNDAVLRKEVPFGGHKSEITYLTEF